MNAIVIVFYLRNQVYDQYMMSNVLAHRYIIRLCSLGSNEIKVE